MESNDFIDRIIGHYRIKKVIGEGTFGRVHQAQNIVLEDIIVAIKILHARHNSLEEQERFCQEASVLRRLKNSFILPFIDLLPHEDLLCLITEYSEQGSLQNRLRNLSSNLLSWQEVNEILSQVGTALQFIHQQNVIHRDLKPANILFNAEGKALLADFGIARIATAKGIESERRACGGTPAYMAPEQIRDRATPQSDQYAFACTAFQLLTIKLLLLVPTTWTYGSSI